MTRALYFIAVWCGYFALALAAVAVAQSLNLLDDNVLDLSGQAIMIAERRGTVADVVTAYPPLPLVLSIPFAYLAIPGVFAGALATAFVTAMFATALFRSMRSRRFSWWAAQVAVLCVVASPLMLQALIAGPGAMLLVLAMLMLALGLFGLAEKGAAPDVMLTGFALLLMAFVHPFGMILAAACLPALAVAAPPAALMRAPVSLFLVLAFPLGFSILAFGYVRWLFGADPFGFIATAGSPAFGIVGGGASLAAACLRAFLAVILAAPVITAFFVWTRTRRPTVIAGVALVGIIVGAVFLQIAFGGQRDQVLILAACLPVAAVCAMQAPRSHVYELYICILLVAGIAGGRVAVSAYAAAGDAPQAAAARAAARTETLQFGEILRQAEGLLIDTSAHPEFVAARGTAKGLVVPGEPDFELQLKTRQLTSPFIAVRRSGVTHTPDRLNVTFPDLYDSGAPGYRLVYGQDGWRVYARLTPERTPGS